MESPKKRILYTLPNFKTAGSKYVLLAIYHRLDRQMFEPLIVVERFPENFPDEIPEENRLFLSREMSTSSYIRKFKKLLQKKQIDLVHSWDYRSASLEAIASKLAGVPYIYTKKNNAWSKRWFAKSLLSKHIAYNNPEMRERFFDHPLLRSKVSFIPHGIDTQLFGPIPHQRDLHKFVIGCLGVLGPNKNQLFLLKALNHLPESFKVKFYGNADSEYEKIIREYVTAQGLEERVSFEGFVENREVPEILSHLDVLVLASHQEGLPLCILEAMSCGIPVLSSDSGGGARYLLSNGGGTIFSLSDVQNLVSPLQELAMNKELRERYAKEGRENAMNEFSLEKEVAAYESLYGRILVK
jgi:glycosyltransferase involved in cell wall biosynthesis